MDAMSKTKRAVVGTRVTRCGRTMVLHPTKGWRLVREDRPAGFAIIGGLLSTITHEGDEP